jgi:cytochrome b pre-mRNA-processing protein 3
MLRLLFPRLTADRDRGAELFRWVTERAREQHWYVAGAVPDSVDGRFAMLSTIAAVVLVRLESGGEDGIALSAALTERFVDAMTAEHREMGMGDPTLGRTVRALVGALSRRVDLLRQATAGGEWRAAARASVYGSAEPAPDSLLHTETQLRDLGGRIESTSFQRVVAGEIQ